MSSTCSIYSLIIISWSSVLLDRLNTDYKIGLSYELKRILNASLKDYNGMKYLLTKSEDKWVSVFLPANLIQLKTGSFEEYFNKLCLYRMGPRLISMSSSCLTLDDEKIVKINHVTSSLDPKASVYYLDEEELWIFTNYFSLTVSLEYCMGQS